MCICYQLDQYLAGPRWTFQFTRLVCSNTFTHPHICIYLLLVICNASQRYLYIPLFVCFSYILWNSLIYKYIENQVYSFLYIAESFGTKKHHVFKACFVKILIHFFQIFPKIRYVHSKPHCLKSFNNLCSPTYILVVI